MVRSITKKAVFFAAALLTSIVVTGGILWAAERDDIVRLHVGRSLLLRAKANVYRTAIVDQTVCDILQPTPSEISIIGRATGQTDVTFWFADPRMKPLTYTVEVRP
jgi:pilus assembly protein CpaC